MSTNPRTDTATEVLCRISLEQGVVEQYERRAKELGMLSAEYLMRRTLQQFSYVDSTKPLIINDKNRQILETLLGRNFSDTDSLISSITRALQLQVDSVEIPLTPRLLERLHSRCIGMQFDKFIKMTVKRLLEEFAGVR